MCKHIWQKYGSANYCVRCGLTKTADGHIFFDRKLPNYKTKKKKRSKK